ncbi:transglutaminase-like domain-containing protein [Clostridium sp. C8-1-8]|uniref:transglutaminase-like domain-containing protein n=1 Tax=Clostridium sp. C8-1-8 TaxID=2698831 RepID=UPI001368C43E|nr:transglutaminase-like domain-containing protein [Clostridium sp. C8-1-8]
MEWIKEKSLNIIVSFLNILLVILTLRACLNIDGTNYFFIIILFLIGLLIYWVYDDKVKSLEKKLILTMGLLCFILLLTIVFKLFITSFVVGGITKNMSLINTNMRAGRASDFSLIENLLIIIIPTATPIIMWMLKRGLADILVLVNIIIMTLYWYLGYYEEINKVMYLFVFVSMVTYGINHFGVYIRKLKRKEIRNSITSSRVLASVITLAVITSIVISVIPKSASGRFSKIITDKVVENIADNGGNLGNPDKYGYSLAKSGYSDTSKILGGPISIDDREALKLEYKGSNKSPIYLKGSVKEKYTGSAWVSEYKQIEKADSMDQYYNDKFVGTNVETMTIHPDYVTTTTLFTPYYPFFVKLKYNSDNATYVDKANEAFYSQRPIKTEYTINFYSRSNYDTFLDQAPTKPEAIETVALYNNGDLSNYLQLPDTITQRTVDLVSQIVKGASSNAEKTYKIKEYLTKNYQYSLDVSSVPQGRDFVDYFLFEEKKGYCVYFATAMTVMCRIAGIPARYVEGFKATTDKTYNNMYRVTNEDAHAWSEVYLDGQQIQGDHVARTVVFTKVDTAPSAYQYRHKKTADDESLASAASGGNISSSSSTSSKASIKDKEQDNKLASEDKPYYYKYIKIILPVAIVLIYFLVRIVAFKLKKQKVYKYNSLIPLYEYSLSRLRKIKITKELSETDLEFAKNISDEKLSLMLKELIDNIYKEFYGEENGLNYNRSELVDYIESILKDNQGNIKYVIRKYVLF